MKNPFNSTDLFRLVFAALLLLIVFIVVDFAAAISLLLESKLFWIGCAVALMQIQIVLSAYRWYLTARCLDHPLSFRTALGEYYLATAINLSLPGGVMGDAARVVRTKHSGWSSALQSVVIERMTGQLVLWIVVLFAWIGVPWMGNVDWLPAYVEPLKIITGLFLFVALSFVAAHLLAVKRLRRFVEDFRLALVKSWFTKRLFFLQLSLSIGVVATYLGVFSLSAAAVGNALDVSVILLIVPLVLLSMLIPLSAGSWGIREVSVVGFWTLLGLPTDSGLATSLLYGFVSLLSVLPGALLWLSLNRN